MAEDAAHEMTTVYEQLSTLAGKVGGDRKAVQKLADSVFVATAVETQVVYPELEAREAGDAVVAAGGRRLDKLVALQEKALAADPDAAGYEETVRKFAAAAEKHAAHGTKDVVPLLAALPDKGSTQLGELVAQTRSTLSR